MPVNERQNEVCVRLSEAVSVAIMIGLPTRERLGSNSLRLRVVDLIISPGIT